MARQGTMVVALAGVLAAVGLVAPAGAVFPGANGKIIASTWGECGSDGDFLSGPTWLAGVGGRAARLVLRGKSRELQVPVFSPDGRRLLYRSDRGIMVARADGSRPRRLTSNPYDSAPAWAPGGDAVAFIRSTARGGGLYVIRPDGGGSRRLLAQRAVEVAWSPSGDRLAVMADIVTTPGPYPSYTRKILVMSRDGSISTEIGSVTVPGPAGYEIDLQGKLSWSRAGWLAYRRYDGALYVSRADAPQERVLALGLAGTEDYQRDYSWSPDGQRLALSRFSNRFEVFNVADGTKQTFAGAGWPPLFSPDGRLVATVGGNHILVTPMNGGRTRRAFRVPPSRTRRERKMGCGTMTLDDIDWQARPHAH